MKTAEELIEEWQRIEPYDSDSMARFAETHCALLLACAEILKRLQTNHGVCTVPGCTCTNVKPGEVRMAIGNLEAGGNSDSVAASRACSHDRLNEDGICRACGADCRGSGGGH